ncbi:MAG: hypothetical protein EBQ98_04240, partial [Actinobacteria bacterium]|nr:hypothetical protein [Actinomycetota bacterium]
MIVPGSVNPLLLKSAAAAGGLQVSRSLRFNSADSAYLNRTPSSTSSQTTWTWSGWVKRSAFNTTNNLFVAGTASPSFAQIRFANQNLDFEVYNSSAVGRKVTTAVYRDSSAWYHIVAAWDTTNATAADRMRIYVNGVRETNFSTSNDPALNSTGVINTNIAHRIGTFETSTEFFNGYLANIHFIDGQALTPASFAETDATTGQWIPKAFSGGSYGTNGFYLKFDDNSSNTASTLGKDYSGLGNNWTPNNLSVTAGAGNDSLVDVPTNGAQTDTGVGGEVRGNYATFNPLSTTNTGGLANGNLQQSGLTNSHATIRYPSSGKWYFEVTPSQKTAGYVIGIQALAMPTTPSTSNTMGVDEGGNRYNGNGTSTSGFLSAIGVGDTLGVAVDRDANTINFYRNGTAGASTLSPSNLGSDIVPFVHTNAATVDINFGQRPFAYT